MAPSPDGTEVILSEGTASADVATSQAPSNYFDSSDQLSEITVLGNKGERGWQGNNPDPKKGVKPIRDPNGNIIGWNVRNPQTGKSTPKSLEWGRQNGLDPSNFSVPVIPEIAPYVSVPGGIQPFPSASPNFGSVADWAAALNALLQSLEYAVP